MGTSCKHHHQKGVQVHIYPDPSQEVPLLGVHDVYFVHMVHKNCTRVRRPSMARRNHPGAKECAGKGPEKITEDNPWEAVPGLSIGPDNALDGDTARLTSEPHTTLRTQFTEVSEAPPSPAS